MSTSASLKQIAMIGSNRYYLNELQTIPNANSYQFHTLTDLDIAADQYSEFNISKMLKEFDNKLGEIDKGVDGITTYLDFPYSMITPILCKRNNLPSATLESILKSHHKYWGRTLHREIIPEATPDFCVLDPFENDPLSNISVSFPFWLKPVKSLGSYLGFRIENERDFNIAIGEIRKSWQWAGQPLNDIMALSDVPSEIRQIKGHFCLAEQLIGGRLCTAEGYVLNGEVTVHGIVDSIVYPNKLQTFKGFEYPSRLPPAIQHRMIALTKKILRHIQYDNNAFNIEFYWDKTQDIIWLVEINTRVAKEFTEIFRLVDGVSNLQIAVSVALQCDPSFPYRKGKCRHAGNYHYLAWGDGVVEAIPSASEIQAFEEDIQGVKIRLFAKVGQRLRTLVQSNKDVYQVAKITVGVDSYSALEEKYQACEAWLDRKLKIAR